MTSKSENKAATADGEDEGEDANTVIVASEAVYECEYRQGPQWLRTAMGGWSFASIYMCVGFIFRTAGVPLFGLFHYLFIQVFYRSLYKSTDS